MDWTKDDRESRQAARLLAFETVQPACPSGVVRLHCADADDGREFDIPIRLSPSQARDLARGLLKLALETEATLFDRP